MFGGGWVTEVSQSAYGHRARKRTWLYYVGPEPPPSLDWSEPPATAVVSQMQHGTNVLDMLTKKQAQATPPAFKALLISMAQGVRP